MGRLGVIKYFRDQFSSLPPVSDYQVDLSGKTVVVVGANVGLGLEAARHFATMNPGRLILACRNMEKAEGAIKDIQGTTGCKTLEPWVVDLSDFKTVSAFADRYEKDGGGRLDILLMNAGVNDSKFKKTVDDWEVTIQVNHLSTSLLILLLLPYLKKTPASPPTPRVVVVSSEVHYLISRLKEAKAPKILEELNDEKHAIMRERYFVSKLFNLFFVKSLASRLPTPCSDTPSLTITSVNPGWCRTELMRDLKNTFSGQFVRVFQPIMGRTSEAGSRTLVWAALADKDSGAAVHGRYTASCRVEEESDYALSPEGLEVQERLWKETLEILRNVDPRVDKIVEECLESV